MGRIFVGIPAHEDGGFSLKAFNAEDTWKYGQQQRHLTRRMLESPGNGRANGGGASLEWRPLKIFIVTRPAF